MKNEKPIIMGAESILAILNLKPNTWPPKPIDPSKSWKWQTRRVMKSQPHAGIRKNPFVKSGLEDWYGYEIKCPYPPGTILWVRERWTHAFADTTVCGSTYTLQDQYIYKADNPDLIARWCPSRYMPREAARLFLEVKNVRAERVQAITEEDAKAEGADAIPVCPDYCHCENPETSLCMPIKWINSYKAGFEMLWDTLYAKRGYSWESNPWVWVYEFEKM